MAVIALVGSNAATITKKAPIYFRVFKSTQAL